MTPGFAKQAPKKHGLDLLFCDERVVLVAFKFYLGSLSVEASIAAAPLKLPV